MIRKLTYFHFFIFSLLILVMSAAVWYFMIINKPQKGQEAYTSLIQTKVDDEVRLLEEELVSVEQLITNDKLDYSSFLTIDTKYPFYIFRYGVLFFWSDNKFVPKYNDIDDSEKTGFVQLSIGKFIYVKKNLPNNYEVVSLIPLSYEYSISNNYITSGLNQYFFQHEKIELNNFISTTNSPIYAPDKSYLFSIDFLESKVLVDDTIIIGFFILVLFSIVIYLIGLYRLVNLLVAKDKTLTSLAILLIGLTLFRVLMLLYNFPFSFVEFDLFNAKYFASSEMSPSMGDLFLNILSFSLFSWFFLKNYTKLKYIKQLISIRGRIRTILKVGSSMFALLVLYYLSYIFYEVYSNSQYSYDITQSVSFNIFKLVGLSIFILVCGLYFIYNHIAIRFYLMGVNGSSKISEFYGILIVSLLAEAGVLVIAPDFWILIPLNLMYWVALIYFSLPKFIGTLKYSTYLYFLLTAFICSFVGAVNLYIVNGEKNIIEKHKYAFQLLNDSDLFAEYLIHESMEEISKDKFIINRFKSIFSTKEVIEQKIQKVILPAYLEKYEVHISLFDDYGDAIIQNAEYDNYYKAFVDFAKDSSETDYDGIYFLNEKDGSPLKRYMAFKSIEENGLVLGNVILEFVHKKNSTSSVYPELLVDKKFITPKQFKNFQYALFDDKLIMSKGNFNYEKYFDSIQLSSFKLYNDGLYYGGYHHLGLKSLDGKTVVVSTESYSLINVLSNFSFLFFLLLIFVLLFIGGYIYYFQYKRVHLNYATKILVYLNIAFFLPLVIVSIVTLSLISTSYRNNQNKSFIEKAERLSVTVLNHFERYQDDPLWESKLENDIAQLSDYTDSDINLFNKDGELLYSYHPALYSKNLLSRYLNPEAFAGIRMKDYSELMLSESLGKLRYNTVYMPVKSYKSGELMGILSIPFFESMQELQQQLIGILTTILNIFSVIFIVFAGLSYLASRILTSPLKIITQKIKKTTYGENNPLEWDSKDEIGMLVAEYNSMISKLEESKTALSKSEKESAWREMAKQVAHEIKNPLTPMKLKIQHLQRGWKDKDSKIEIQTEKGLQTLLDQVNILNEIASSFSAFAKMPIPKNEHFDLAKVLRSTVNLYNNTHDVNVDSMIEEGDYVIDGDPQLMSSIITNLIINAIQSVPEDLKPFVRIDLYTKTNNVCMEIRDNGKGIQESIRDQVFLANFSTKDTGSGIGLAVAKRGVEHAGGRIWFETVIGVGTTFFIEIPLVH